MRRLVLAFAALASLAGGVAGCASQPSPQAAAEQAHQAALAAAVAGPWRSPEHRARDAFRHPAESLSFWGLKPGMTVVEIDPGGEAWWTEILAPYARQTGGRYIAGYVDLAAPNVTDAARRNRAEFERKFADAAVFGPVRAVDFGMTAGLALPDASADFVLVARAFHNWARREGATDRYMAEFARVLRPGGILAVEQHRLPAGQSARPETGYVSEAYVIDAARRAGLVLDGRSEINANPRDDTDHPFGVWTLPPGRRTSPVGQPDNPAYDRSAFEAIGESDRMTLRFRKPG
jgi:predicted methyltransferase